MNFIPQVGQASCIGKFYTGPLAALGAFAVHPHATHGFQGIGSLITSSCFRNLNTHQAEQRHPIPAGITDETEIGERCPAQDQGALNSM